MPITKLHPLFIIIFTVLCSHFSLALFTDSHVVNRTLIEEGISRCCPTQWVNCCRERLLANEQIKCPELPYEKAFSMGICLDEHFFGADSLMAIRAHNCCWLLSGEECQKDCYAFLRAPSRLLKWEFTKKCLEMTLNATVNITGLDCLNDRKQVLESCFSSCIHWQTKHRGNANGEDRYCPILDCPEYAQLRELDSCLIPLHLVQGNGIADDEKCAMKRKQREMDGAEDG